MPAKYTHQFSITYSPSNKDNLQKDSDIIYEFLKQKCTKGGRCGEHGEQEYVTHFQFGAVLKAVSSCTLLRKQILTALGHPEEHWTEAEKAHTLVVHAHHNVAGLLGGYLTKEEDTRLEYFGFIEEELAAGAQERAEALETRAKRDISKDKYIELLADQWITEYGTGITDVISELEIRLLQRSLLGRGYRFFKHVPRSWTNTHLQYLSDLINLRVNQQKDDGSSPDTSDTCNDNEIASTC